MSERIAILGSTGSIGVNTLDVVSRLKGRFEVVGLSADSNIGLLARQTKRFRPKIISVGEASLAARAKRIIPSGTKITFGGAGLNEIVGRSDVDAVVFAISGNACLVPLVNAIKKKKRIALANKEALVSAGRIITRLAKRNSVSIIPIDSEHSAIFQCLEGRSAFLSRIYLTGSGGPLLNVAAGKFDEVSQAFILKHPKWRMGRKISVDSATMMNKGLEIIEAMYLFDIEERFIEVLVHPEAIIHSMVELTDGSVFAQLAVPDMRLPIQYALTYPERPASGIGNVDFGKIGALSFRRPDLKKFPCLGLARRAARSGGTAPAVLSACDEEVVKVYLEGAIKFSRIPGIVEKVLARHKNITDPSIGDVLNADAWAREETRSICYR